jgi:BlaI family transcriptional regulator, penicillinase repressor
MARPVSKHPTELELEILKILWDLGPLPTRDVRVALSEGDARRDLAHTSVVTILNIMVKKKYLRRTKSGAAYTFYPLIGREDVSQNMLDDLVDRVFDGSATHLMLNLLERTDLDANEIQRLRKLISRKAKEEKQ